MGKIFNRYIAFTVGFLVLFSALVFLKYSPGSVLTENSVPPLEENHIYATALLKIFDQNTAVLKKNIQVDLAQTPAEHTRGLSGRKSLAADRGMLFIFEKSDSYGFWMPEMFISIDILWINEQKKIVHVEKNVTPDSYPKIFKPSAAAKYVLEVPAGFSDLNAVTAGDAVDFILP